MRARPRPPQGPSANQQGPNIRNVAGLTELFHGFTCLLQLCFGVPDALERPEPYRLIDLLASGSSGVPGAPGPPRSQASR